MSFDTVPRPDDTEQQLLRKIAAALGASPAGDETEQRLLLTIAGLVASTSDVYASQVEAEAGTNNTKVMTPLRTAEAIAALASSGTPSFSSITGSPGDNTALAAALAAKLDLAGGTMTGALVNSANGATSTPAIKISGTPFAAGTATTNKALLLLEPAGTTSTGWSTAGTMLGVNAASGFAGNLLDLQKAGVSLFSVETVSGGFARVANSLQFGGGAVNACGIGVHSSDNLLFNSDGEYVMKLYNTRLLLQNTAQFAISENNAYNGTADVGFARSSAGVARVSNGSTGRGTLDAAGYQVGGVAGAAGGTFTAITSITVVNGIITAISGT